MRRRLHPHRDIPTGDRALFHFKPSKQPPNSLETETGGPPTGTPPSRPPHGGPSPEVSPRSEAKLLRKEVIQPHLPVRLPCYDFVPIASPTFDHSPPCGLGRGLRVLPTFVT